MQIKRLAALSLAAVFTACLLAGCDLLAWLAWLEENSDSSSVTSSPSSSSSSSRPSYDDDDDEDDSNADEESSSSSSSSEPEKPAPDPAKPETWQVSEDGSTLIVPEGASSDLINSNLIQDGITSLDLRNSGVTTINKDAFYRCTSLKTVTMGDVTTIDFGAFDGCESLQTVTMGDVTTIGENAFTACINLRTVDMGVVRNIVKKAFVGCQRLTSIRFENDVNTAPNVDRSAFKDVGVATGGVTVYSDWAVQNRDTVTGWFPHLPHPLVHTSGYNALTFP